VDAGLTVRERSRFERELLELDLPSHHVFGPGRGETPAPVRLTHFHTRKFLSGGTVLLSDSSPGVMTPARMSPGYVDDARRVALQGALETLIRGKYARNISPKANLQVALADLTESKFHRPIFAGFSSWGRPPDGQMSGASLPKILALYALYQLRFDLNHFAREQGIKKEGDLRVAIVKEWVKAGLTKAPSLRKLFRLVERTSGDPVQATLHRTPAIHSNWAARELIEDLGFEYIGSVALQSGLFAEATGGLWLNAAYEKPAVTWLTSPFPRLHRHNVSAFAAATFFTLLAQGRLVDQATSNEIAAVLRSKKCFDKDGLIDGIKTLPGFPTSGGLPVTPPNKCGELAPHYHDAMHIERPIPGGKRLEYTVAVLSEMPPNVDFKELGKDLDALIVAQN
jgi:hypothetical protein